MATLAIATAPAGAVTFGAAFARPSDVTETCAGASWAPAGPQSSCTFWSLDPGGVYYAPTSGTVTRVRVQVGPSTGPMQVVVLYTLRQNNPPPNAGNPVTISGPFQGPLGPMVQPNAPNSVATVDTQFPMIEQAPPAPGDYSSVTRNDFLAISVLDPNTAIPAISDPNALLRGAAPAPASGNPYAASYVGGGSGYIALNADLTAGTPAGGGTPPPAGGGTPPPAGGGTPPPASVMRPIAVDLKGAGLNGNTGSVPLTCVLTVACNGTLTLLPRGAHGATKKLTTYGRARFSIAAGRTQIVKVKLNASGRKKLKGHKSLKVIASARVGGKTVTRALTFKLATRR